MTIRGQRYFTSPQKPNWKYAERSEKEGQGQPGSGADTGVL